MGRPKGSRNRKTLVEENRTYRCACCGTEYSAQKNNFYVLKSDFYRGNNNHSTICVNCLMSKFREIESQTRSSRMALICICHMIDAFYNEKTFNTMMSKGTFSLGDYLRSLNGRQWSGNTFITNLLHNDFASPVELDDKNIDVEETKEDRRNREFVLSRLKYDPFIGEYPPDRILLFNTLSDYLTDDVCEDPHKLQSVVPMVRSILQESKLDKLIGAELNNPQPNNEKLKALTDNKDKIRKTINTIAKENGISDGNGRANRGANTLTGIMREMVESDFEEVKVNVVDAKMAKAYKAISDISNKSLFEQLNYQADDYARLLADQRELLQKSEEEKMILEEQLRLAKLQIEKLKDAGAT